MPHTEIDLILVNGQSVNFNFLLQENEEVFEAIDITPFVRLLQPKPLREIKFFLDIHLGKLARYLRLLGLDTLYHTMLEENQIILT